MTITEGVKGPLTRLSPLGRTRPSTGKENGVGLQTEPTLHTSGGSPKSSRRRVRLALFATAMSIASIGGVTGASPASAYETAPTCVHFWTHNHWFGFHVHVKNYCSSYQRVKVVLRYYGDSRCIGLSPGEEHTHRHSSGGFVGGFDRLEKC